MNAESFIPVKKTRRSLCLIINHIVLEPVLIEVTHVHAESNCALKFMGPKDLSRLSADDRCCGPILHSEEEFRDLITIQISQSVTGSMHASPILQSRKGLAPDRVEFETISTAKDSNVGSTIAHLTPCRLGMNRPIGGDREIPDPIPIHISETRDGRSKIPAFRVAMHFVE